MYSTRRAECIAVQSVEAGSAATRAAVVEEEPKVRMQKVAGFKLYNADADCRRDGFSDRGNSISRRHIVTCTVVARF